jgi:hypothetical protein
VGESAVEFISIADFQQEFLYQQSLLGKDTAKVDTFEHYLQELGLLRSRMISQLRYAGMPGSQRAFYNDALQDVTLQSHRDWLYALDKTCRICGEAIATREEATIDHIMPRSHGGANALDNKQLAHGKCNVFKSNKLEYRHAKMEKKEKFAEAVGEKCTH